MLLYTCVAEYFSKPDTSGYLGFLSENLEGDTNVLQAFLGEWVLLSSSVVQQLATRLFVCVCWGGGGGG